jgi:putative transposase
MRKNFTYRIIANKTTLDNANSWLTLCRHIYNIALEQRIMVYKQNKGKITCYEQMKQLSDLRVEFPEYKNVDMQVLRDPLERLDRAYQGFFKRVKQGKIKVGFPRFKSSNRYNSFTLKQHSWKLKGKYIIIRNVGTFKLYLSRPIEGNIKTITIKRSSTNRWYAIFSCDNVPENILPKSDKTVGIDVGIKSFLVDSDGNKVENPTYYKKSEKLLRRRQRVLCRRKKGSNGRRKARIVVAKAHEKVINQRRDFLHKTSSLYIKNYSTLIFEDLNINGMVKNSHLAKSISDTGWGLFYGLCSYKAEEAGRDIIRIPRFEPTSKTCSECGAINQELKLSDRNWLCKSCGTYHDRDFNAAKNIKRVGQTQQELTYGSSQSVSCESTLVECQSKITEVSKFKEVVG